MYAAAAIPIAYSLFPIAFTPFPNPHSLIPNPYSHAVSSTNQKFTIRPIHKKAAPSEQLFFHPKSAGASLRDEHIL